MKKYFSIVLALSIFTACQKQPISPESGQLSFDTVAGKNDNKVNICHHNSGNNSWNEISISMNALLAHLAHGDAVDIDEDSYYTIANGCSNGIDCNDDDALINPGTEENCGNSIDDNCDGQIDENCTVTICNKTWMTRNLDVSQYRNGEYIFHATTTAEWQQAGNTGTGAWCWFNFNSDYGVVYGRLYNWFAVNDPRGLAPQGWHIPSDAEWNSLITCIDPGANLNAVEQSAFAGGALKETGIIHWNSPNTGATNSVGFTGLPAGNFNFSGNFINLGQYGFWWTSTPLSEYAWHHYVRHDYAYAGRSITGKVFGLSVRCVRD